MDKAKTIVVGDRVHRPLMDDQVTAEDWEKARKELKETPETREILLRRLKEKLAEEEFIPRTDDIYLLRFLRVRKFDLKRTHKMIRDFYKFRSKHPDAFALPSSIENVLRSNIFNFLPHRDHMGRAVFLIKIRKWDPEKISFNAFVAAANAFCDNCLDNPVTQINGFVSLFDCKGFGLKQLIPLCSPKNLWTLINQLQDHFPGRLKSMYCVNSPYLVNTAWCIVKPFLREKLRNRLTILGSDITELHQFIDPSILPKECGGVMPPSDCADFAERILAKEHYFSYDRSFGYPARTI